MQTQFKTNARIGNRTYNKYVDIRFDDWSDMLNVARAHANDPEMARREPHSMNTSNPRWSGSPSLEAAIHVAETGWPEATAQVQEMRDKIYNVVCNKVVRDRVFWDVAGATVDVGAYVEGIPDHMMEFEQVTEQGSGRIIHLIINMSVNWMVKGWRIQNRGAALVAMVDALENAHYRVEITAIICTSGNGIDWGISQEVPIKAAEQPLDVDRLVFALAHPSMLRRIGFAVREAAIPCEDWSRYHMGMFGNYGCPVEHPEYRKNGATYFRTMDERCMEFDTTEQCVAQVIQWLHALDIPVDETAAV